jgi:hypothetical protein
MKWYHIDFWFKRKDNNLTDTERCDFEVRLAILITKIQPRRKFYLYEDVPHCFLAIQEHWFWGYALGTAKKVFEGAEYINYICLAKNTKDEANGEGWLDVMNAMTDFYLFKRDNSITHLVHCSLEFMMKDRIAENKFYQNMAICYQETKLRNKKVVYSYKKITPAVKKKMQEYINQHDLRRKNG